jgi:hypothetical protein
MSLQIKKWQAIRTLNYKIRIIFALNVTNIMLFPSTLYAQYYCRNYFCGKRSHSTKEATVMFNMTYCFTWEKREHPNSEYLNNKSKVLIKFSQDFLLLQLNLPIRKRGYIYITCSLCSKGTSSNLTFYIHKLLYLSLSLRFASCCVCSDLYNFTINATHLFFFNILHYYFHPQTV